MIAFLHTSDIHIEKFQHLVRKYDKKIEVKHFVHKELLDFALEQGYTDTKSFEKELMKIRSLQPKLIICTCSTYGKECDEQKAVERIDGPIAEFLILNFKKIGLAYTAHSTKKISEELLYKTALDKNKNIQIVNCDCTGSWKYYERNDLLNYSKSIAERLMDFESQVEVIFLAQASMEGAKTYMKDFSKEVFSSPDFGVRSYLKNK